MWYWFSEDRGGVFFVVVAVDFLAPSLVSYSTGAGYLSFGGLLRGGAFLAGAFLAGAFLAGAGAGAWESRASRAGRYLAKNSTMLMLLPSALVPSCGKPWLSG